MPAEPLIHLCGRCSKGKLAGIFCLLSGAALLLTLLTAPAMNAVLGSLFWFLSYCFTLWPVLAAIPVFTALGSLIPVLSSHAEARHSIVERLRQE